MKRLSGLFAISCLAICACGTEGESASNEASQAVPSDEEVMAMAYDSTYTVPANFFADERADTTRSFTIYHVKDESISYELCSNDYAEAAAWESADNASRSVNGVYVESYENDRYFEFVRELDYPDGVGNITDPTSPGFSRVFKCSYVNRDGVDRNLRGGYAGTLNVRPLSEEAIRTFTEYMWQFTFFWPAQKTVLGSFSDERADAYQHTLTLAFVTNRGIDNCDLVEVVDWVFTVDKTDGQVTKGFNLRYQFNAELVNGAPRKCEN
jgi:hypothetical protein